MGRIRKGIKNLTVPSKKEVRRELIFTFIIIMILIGVIYLGDTLGLKIIEEIL